MYIVSILYMNTYNLLWRLKIMINFLDVILINDNNSIIFNLFQKSTFSRRYLNFNSQSHPLDKKKKKL